MAEEKCRLKATKSSLYELAKRHFDMPVKRWQTEFSKVPGMREYSLEFVHDGSLYHFLLGTCTEAGTVMLGRNVYKLHDRGDWTWDTVEIGPDELLELGMAEPAGGAP